MDARTNLFGLSREQLAAALTALGEPAYRGSQVYRWLYRKRVRAIAEMTDVPKPVRDKIARRLRAALARRGRAEPVRSTAP